MSCFNLHVTHINDEHAHQNVRHFHATLHGEPVLISIAPTSKKEHAGVITIRRIPMHYHFAWDTNNSFTPTLNTQPIKETTLRSYIGHTSTYYADIMAANTVETVSAALNRMLDDYADMKWQERRMLVSAIEQVMRAHSVSIGQYVDNFHAYYTKIKQWREQIQDWINPYAIIFDSRINQWKETGNSIYSTLLERHNISASSLKPLINSMNIPALPEDYPHHITDLSQQPMDLRRLYGLCCINIDTPAPSNILPPMDTLYPSPSNIVPHIPFNIAILSSFYMKRETNIEATLYGLPIGINAKIDGFGEKHRLIIRITQCTTTIAMEWDDLHRYIPPNIDNCSNMVQHIPIMELTYLLPHPIKSLMEDGDTNNKNQLINYWLNRQANIQQDHRLELLLATINQSIKETHPGVPVHTIHNDENNTDAIYCNETILWSNPALLAQWASLPRIVFHPNIDDYTYTRYNRVIHIQEKYPIKTRDIYNIIHHPQKNERAPLSAHEYVRILRQSGDDPLPYPPEHRQVTD